MHHTQLPDTIHSDKVCSARQLAGISSVAFVFVADLSLLESCNRSTITNDSHGDLRFQDCDFTSHFLSNQQFSVTAVTTSTGSVAERYAYTAYGQPTFLDASGTPLTTQTSTLNARYLYTGREWDATLGLYHFRARWMSGAAGRFMGRDPIGYLANAMGLYEFVHSSVLNYVDPSGNQKTVVKQTPSGPDISIEYPSKGGGPAIEIPIKYPNGGGDTPPVILVPQAPDPSDCPVTDCGKTITFDAEWECSTTRPCTYTVQIPHYVSNPFGHGYCWYSTEKRTGTQKGEGTRPGKFTYICKCTIGTDGSFKRGKWTFYQVSFPGPQPPPCNVKTWGACY